MRVFILAIALLFSSFTGNAQTTRFSPIKIVTAGSMGTSLNSIPVDMTTVQNASIMAVWTGTPVGTLKLQISNDIVDSCTQVTNWVDYSGSSTAVSSAGNFEWNLGIANYKCLRMVYTRSSSTGTMNAIAGVK